MCPLGAVELAVWKMDWGKDKVLGDQLRGFCGNVYDK